ncbi:hypothetical protein A2U01_0055758, partial [Trifolium medium]|nr:hypothetical protein [Trifolium medium]
YTGEVEDENYVDGLSVLETAKFGDINLQGGGQNI